MSDMCVGGARRHDTSKYDEDPSREAAKTNAVLERATGTTAKLRGDDRTWRETKTEQKGHLGVGAGVEATHAVIAAIELGGGCLGLGVAIAGPVIALGAGIHGIVEARGNGKAQAAAAAKDTVRTAMIAALDLPESYKSQRLNDDHKDVAKGSRSLAFAMTEKLMADKPALARLQARADKGMEAGRDSLRVGAKPEDLTRFLAANPKIAEAREKDPAFREGFEAYRAIGVAAHAGSPAAKEAIQATDEGLAGRDAWSACNQVQVRS